MIYKFLDARVFAETKNKDRTYQWFIQDNEGGEDRDAFPLGMVRIGNLKMMLEIYPRLEEIKNSQWPELVCEMLNEMLVFCQTNDIKYINLI